MLAVVVRTWGHVVVRRSILVLAAWFVLTLGAGILALTPATSITALHHATVTAPQVPGTAMASANETADGPEAVLAISGLDLKDAKTAAAVGKALAASRDRLNAIPGVSVIDPFALPDGLANAAAQSMLATDGSGFLLRAQLDPTLGDKRAAATIEKVIPALRDVPGDLKAVAPDVTGVIGADQLVEKTAQTAARHALKWGIALGLGAALIACLLAFAGLWRAAVPAAGIGSGLGITLVVISLLDRAAPSAANVLGATMLASLVALAASCVPLAAELVRRLEPGERLTQPAAEAALGTVGRAIGCGLAGAMAIMGCLAFFAPPEFQRAALYGAIAMAIAAVISLLAVPAGITLVATHASRAPRAATLGPLAVWCRRVALPGPGERPAVAHPDQAQGDERPDDGERPNDGGRGWPGRRWRTVLVLGVAALAVAAVPIGSMRLVETSGTPPADSQQRAFDDLYATKYAAPDAAPIRIRATTSLEAAQEWTAQLAKVPGVHQITTPSATEDAVIIGAWPTAEAGTDRKAEREVVEAIRALDPGFAFTVGGSVAAELDLANSIRGSAPWAFAAALLAALIAFVAAGRGSTMSVMAFLGLAAACLAAIGAGAWLAGSGHGAELFGLAAPGGLELSVLPLAIALALAGGLLLLAPRLATPRQGDSDHLGGSERPAVWAAICGIAALTPMAFQQFVPLEQLAIVAGLGLAATGFLVVPALLPALAERLGERGQAPRFGRRDGDGVIEPADGAASRRLPAPVGVPSSAPSSGGIPAGVAGAAGDLADTSPQPSVTGGDAPGRIAASALGTTSGPQSMLTADTPPHGIEAHRIANAATPPHGIRVGDRAHSAATLPGVLSTEAAFPEGGSPNATSPGASPEASSTDTPPHGIPASATPPHGLRQADTPPQGVTKRRRAQRSRRENGGANGSANGRSNGASGGAAGGSKAAPEPVGEDK